MLRMLICPCSASNSAYQPNRKGKRAAAAKQVLEKLVLDGSILLVDQIHVKWSDAFRDAHVEWPAFYLQIFTMLGVESDTTIHSSG